MTAADPTLTASRLVTTAFVVLPVIMAALFVAGAGAARDARDAAGATRRRLLATAAAVVVWLAVTWLLAARGVLRRFDAMPPPFVLLLVTILALGPAIAGSPLGARLARALPLAALVGAQAFRLPLELVMHRAYEDGVMPVQMSYAGRNFDIVTGLTAIALALALVRWRVPRWIVLAWNVLGLLLLVNVVTVAIVSTPVFRWFGDEGLNTFVAYPPFVWLPAVLVLAAWAGHLVIFRALAAPGALTTVEPPH